MDAVWRLTRHMEDQIRAHWPTGPGALLAAVSGGADSICLLHLLHRLQDRLDFQLSVLHVHHGIRGTEADLDAQFVITESEKLGLSCELVSVDAPLMAERDSLSLEDAARRLRHQVFQRALKKTGASAVVLAHHRDDQAETVLLHLLRGAASNGLCGMQPLNNGLFRPLLEIPGESLRVCLAENGWPFRVDSSNLDDSYRRNALRQRWIPQLRKQLGHDPTGPLVRFSAMQQQDQAFLSSLARDAAVACRLTDTAGEGTEVSWLKDVFCGLPEPLARRVAVLAWERHTGARVDLEAVHVEAVCHLCRTGSHESRIDLPGFREAVVLGEQCVLRAVQQQKSPGQWSYDVAIPEHVGESRRTTVPEAMGTLVVTRLPTETATSLYPGLQISQQGWMQLVDSSTLPGGILIRNRRAGDRFRPWNAPGERKLKKWFIDQEIPVQERYQLPLLADAENILWVIGQRTANQLLAAGCGDDILLFAWETNKATNRDDPRGHG